jgi:hypothetical protein
LRVPEAACSQLSLAVQRIANAMGIKVSYDSECTLPADPSERFLTGNLTVEIY